MRGILKGMVACGLEAATALAGLLAALGSPRLRRRPRRAAPAARARRAAAGMWLLADADTRIYLFGTVHILHPALRWRSAALEPGACARRRSWCSSSTMSEMAAGGPEAIGTMQLGKSVPLLQRVTPDRRAALARLLAELQIAEGSLDGLETWAVAVIAWRRPDGARIWRRDGETDRAAAGGRPASRRC